ncbi:MAG: hypothetical protein M3033_19230 [Acidobacteriota bacterium]|nr:hypothetical protein [Acidobacteriota bacterium]
MKTTKSKKKLQEELLKKENDKIVKILSFESKARLYFQNEKKILDLERKIANCELSGRKLRGYQKMVIFLKKKNEELGFSSKQIKKYQYLKDAVTLNSRIILKSKKETIINGLTRCDDCNAKATTWRFLKSNHGIVHLCCRCKSSALARSFRGDIMSIAYQGG